MPSPRYDVDATEMVEAYGMFVGSTFNLTGDKR